MKNWSKWLTFIILSFYGGFNMFYTSIEEMPLTGGDVLDENMAYGYNTLFAAAGECNQCHGLDPDGMANVTGEGEDISPVTGWRATMMANSAKDPFWQAKVTHEVAVNPQHQNEIETTCTDCHAPLGFFNAQHNGAEHYLLEEVQTDTFALDGVSCLACHQQVPEGLGDEFSGVMHYSVDPIAYGPYTSPLISPMAGATGFVPEYSEHISEGALCASCHTLITETIDLEGNITDNHFVEQATYHEWLNSSYGEDVDNVTCQKCHMPEINQDIVIASGNDGLPPRNPYYLHDLVGGNVHMLEILKDHIDQLGIHAEEEHFNKTIQKTYSMLQNNALELDLEFVNRTIDTCRFDLKLTNLAGHKFPSGYPARRLFVNFIVKDNEDNILFNSGDWDEDYFLIDESEPFEPHYDVINNDSEVQIYEMVLGDVNGDFTTVLTRAYSPLKDNRLVPNGFSTSHSAYDTTVVAGNAIDDNDFNNFEGLEGSGSDNIQYNIPLSGYDGELSVEATVYYQPIPPKWMEMMFDHETDEILAFKEMFDSASNDPILVETQSLDLESFVSVDEEEGLTEKINYFNGELSWLNAGYRELLIYDVGGKLILNQDISNSIRTMNVGLHSGVYFVVLNTADGMSIVEKILIQ